MAAATQIVPLSDYLATSYRPDREYIDGEVRERNVGKWEHARLQWLLAAWFDRHESDWNVIGSTEQRMQVAPTRVRIPDLVVLRPQMPPEALVEPPILVVEILSPDDSYSDLQERCEDYRAMGVETMWIIDPKTRSGRMCSGMDWIGAETLSVANTPIYVNLTELFARLDAHSRPAAKD
jgi:Uma2 family endonuclease